jgi:drug/metabolite transporter (DMT)-like permease
MDRVLDTAEATREAPAASTLFLFLLPCVIWGTTWLVIKFQLGVVQPEASVAWRFALASLLLVGWCLLRRTSLRFAARQHAGLALLGALLFGLNYVLVYRSEQHLTSGLVAVIFAFIVFWNLLGARLLFGTPVSPAVVLGATIGVAGVGVLFLPQLGSLRGAPSQATGIALACVATLVASAGNLQSQRLFARGVAVVPGTAWAMGYAAVLLVGWCVVRGIPLTFDPRPPYVLSLLYLSFLGSVAAFVSYLTLLRRIGAGRSGYTAAVIPVVAMVASTVFEGYRWTGSALMGMVLVLAGTVLVLRVKERGTASAPGASRALRPR